MIKKTDNIQYKVDIQMKRIPLLNKDLIQLLFHMVNLIHEIHLGIQVVLNNDNIMIKAHGKKNGKKNNGMIFFYYVEFNIKIYRQGDIGPTEL